MNILNLPAPSWMTEDLVLLEEQARRFIAAEYVPQLRGLERAGGMYGARGLDQSRRSGAALPGNPGRVRRRRRNLRT